MDGVPGTVLGCGNVKMTRNESPLFGGNLSKLRTEICKSIIVSSVTCAIE